MVWNVAEAIQALKDDQHTPAAIRSELNRMREGREDRLSVRTKVFIAEHGIKNNESDNNNILWMNQNLSPLNRLIRSKQYSAVVTHLYDHLEPVAREALSYRGANIRLYFNLTEVLSRANKKSRYTRCEELIALIHDDAYLVSIILSTHPELRAAFMHLLTDSVLLQFKPLLNFVLSHDELAGDLKTQLKFIIDNEQQPRETRATLFLREHLAFGVGDEFLRRAIRDNTEYFNDSPEIYTGLLQFNKKQTESILTDSTHFGWKLANALKFLLPNFLRVALNIEPPLKRAELTRLRERYDAAKKPISEVNPMPGNPYHLEELKAMAKQVGTPAKQTLPDIPLAEVSAVRPADTTVHSLSSVRQADATLSNVSSLRQADATLNDVSSLREADATLNSISSVRLTDTTVKSVSAVRQVDASVNNISSVRPADSSLNEASSVRPSHNSLNEVSSVRHAENSLDNVSSVQHPNSSLAQVSPVRQANNSLDHVSPVRNANQSLEDVSPPRQAGSSDQDSDADASSFSPLMPLLAPLRRPARSVSATSITFGSKIQIEEGIDVANFSAEFPTSSASQPIPDPIDPLTGQRYSYIHPTSKH